ncbi:FanG protein [Streptococcus suis]|nr:FanG protein [Streptococcus suis]
MYFNIKHCRCQLQLHQNIDKKLVYQILKSPAIEMITGLNFNIQMIYSSKKGRVLIDFYCNVMKINISKIA